MRMNRGFLFLSLLVFVAAVAPAQETFQEAIPNWPAPATWSPDERSPHSMGRGASTMVAITSPFPFIGVTPCRVADTRGNGFVGQYGPPALVANATRSFTITGQCGIPASAAAVSFNFGALNVGGAGDLRVFPAGGAVPLVSTMNYNANTPNIANAAVVPLGTGGAITVQADAVSIDLIIDVNGYYAAAGVGTQNTFLGLGAGNFTMTGDSNTGVGHNALLANGTGAQNTATGAFALSSNAGGNANTATGDGALQFNSGGNSNTATGAFALQMNVGGASNVAFGDGALQFDASGNANIAIGTGAGSVYTTESSNICIGNPGVASDFKVTRIGSVQTKAFIAGVNGVTTGGTGTPVLIDSNGQLGTISSSVRFKDEVHDMGEATEGLMKLRPVTFRYKAQPDRTQFGLIAEEVEKVMPELVVCSSSGEAETVLYHEMPAMLLNELQKQERQIEELKSELAALRAAVASH